MNLYELINEMRREDQTPGTSRTLDILVVELGQTRDNLREAVRNLRERPLPEGGQKLLDRLLWRAERERIDDLYYSPSTSGGGSAERAIPLDDATAGIGVLLAGTALLVFALTVAAVVAGLAKLFHWFGA